jgi:hypothetical protein
MYYINEERGITVKPTEHTATAASTAKIGLLALLGAFLGFKGASASKTGRGSGAPTIAHRRLLATIFVSGVALMFSGAPAQAATTHPYTGISFGPGGVGAGSFGGVVGITVEQSSGNVFVLDKAEGGRVYKFDAAGEPVDFSSSATNVIEGVGSAGGSEEQIAIDESSGPAAGDIYVANTTGVRIYAASGALLGELERPDGGEFCGVAVDSSGDVYVGNYPGTVRRFTPAANPVTNLEETGTISGLHGVCNVAVDSAGDVYAATYTGGVNKYDALQFGSLAAEGEAVDPTGRTLAVDSANGSVFVDKQTEIEEYEGSTAPPTPAGTSGESGPGALDESFGVAVDHASGDVYAGDGEAVEIFGPGVVVAGATTEAASGISATEATLHGSVLPAGTEVSECHFEYGTEAGVLSQSAPCEPAPPYTGSSSVAVSAQLSGLHPGASYHYRLAASGTSGSLDGLETSFRAAFLERPPAAIGLPDGRGYEMVTPAENEGGELYSPRGDGQEGEGTVFTKLPSIAASNGEAVVYAGTPAAGGNGSQGDGSGNQFLAKRNPGGGWTQSDIQPAGYSSPSYWAFSANLEQGILDTNQALVTGVPVGYEDLYARDDETGSLHPFSTVTPPSRSAGQFGSPYAEGGIRGGSLGEHYAGASTDMSHLLFEANDALTSSAIDPGPGENNLYESLEGEVRSVNVLPDGTPAPNAFFGAAPVAGAAEDNFSHVISSSGARIFWTDLNSGSLYVRENATSTSLIAEAATYLTASADGSKVLYTKAGDLYEDDLETDVTRDLAPGGQVLGIMGAGEDLEYVYFVAEAALGTGATVGKPNLYLLHDGATTFIASLGPVTTGGVDQEAWEPDMGERTAQVTPSGRGLVFVSNKSLTGYDNNNGKLAVSEVYVYDADESQLSCVSCNPSGEPPAVLPRPVEDPSGALLQPSGARLPISEHNTYQQRVLSDDGGRVFFESFEPLLPTASNNYLNVYEWERDGEGSCAYPTGCVYLLSSGSSTAPSYFIDASSSGEDVFLMTRSRLVPSDHNEYYDIYDARIGAVEGAAPSQCTGTGCQGSPASPPVFVTPASATFSGVGNFSSVTTTVKKVTKKSVKCKKGFAKQKNKCVKKLKTKKKLRTKKKAKAKKASNDRRASR